jgi:hypothetical protein
MKISLRLLFLATLTLFSISSGAAQSTPVPSFSLTINAVQNTVKAGSEIKITILLKNVSDHEIGIPRSPGENRGESFHDLEVRDEKGHLTPKTKLRREVEEHGTANGEIGLPMGSVFTQTLKPSETLKEGIVVTNIYDLTKPEKYIIQCQRFDDDSNTIVRSNKITVTVTP